MFFLGLVRKVVETIYEHAQEEYYDERKALQELLKIRLSYEYGDIGAEDYTARESKLMDRIAEIRRFHRAQKLEEDEDE